MPRLPLPIGFTFYQSESRPISSQRCVNWIPHVAESAAISTRALFQPLGLKQFANTGLGINRGSITADGVPYFIQGNSLASLDVSGTVTNHGTITGSGGVSLAVNAKNADTGSQFIVIVVPGGNSYAFATVTNVLTQITDANFRTSDTVVFKDGFFVFSASAGDVYFNSNLNNPLVYNALDFGTAEISPDRIIALHVNHNELFIAGGETIELAQNVGGAGFPFQRIPGANVQKGLHAKFSLVEFDNTFCFVGGGKNELSAIWKITGSSSVQKISTDAIDTAIQNFTLDEINDSFAITWAERGQFFAAFTFESDRIASRTFVYNATASQLLGERIWFEMQSGLTDNRWNVQSIASAYGKLLVGDGTNGVIGEMDRDTLSYYGEPIYRHMATQPFDSDGLPIFGGEFEATFQAGVGLTVGQGSDPVVRMDKSDDGGHTFNSETKRKLGKIGEYGHRAIWRRQGRFPVQRTIRLTVTDPIRANLIRLGATPEVGVQSG
jgi:hypothetical protein